MAVSEYPDGWKFATIPLDVAEQLMVEHPILASVIVVHDVDPDETDVADLIVNAGHAGGERPDEPSTDGLCECGHIRGQHLTESPHFCLAVSLNGPSYCDCISYTEATAEALCARCGYPVSFHVGAGQGCDPDADDGRNGYRPPEAPADIHMNVTGGSNLLSNWVRGVLRFP